MIFIKEYFRSVKKIHGPSGRDSTTATLAEKGEERGSRNPGKDGEPGTGGDKL